MATVLQLRNPPGEPRISKAVPFDHVSQRSSNWGVDSQQGDQKHAPRVFFAGWQLWQDLDMHVSRTRGWMLATESLHVGVLATLSACKCM